MSDHIDGRVSLNAGLLKALRKARGLSQDALADLCVQRRLPVSIASIKRAETHKAVLYRTARHLATIFEVSVDALEQRPVAVACRASAPVPALAQARGAVPYQADDMRYVVLMHIELLPTASASVPVTVGSIANRFGGEIGSVADNQVTCVFGLAQAHRSDAERAACAACEVAQALGPADCVCIVLRMGCWRNVTLDAAARPRAGLHGPGPGNLDAPTVYVARELAPQLETRFTLVRSGQRESGYLVFSTGAIGKPEPPRQLVGRTGELRQFKVVLEVTRAQGRGQLVYVRGAAGIGKSRLAQEYGRIGSALGFDCHDAQVYDMATADCPAPIAQFTRSLLRLPACGTPAAGQVEAAIAAVGLPADWLTFYRALCEAPMTLEQKSILAEMNHAVHERGMVTALATLIMRVAGCKPVLLVLEDVHWGGNCLFEMLADLLPLSLNAPLVWVLTSRSEHDPFEASLRPHLFGLPAAILDLAPITAGDALALAAQYPDLDDGYRQQCVERAAGNALFLTQLLGCPGTHLPNSLRHLVQTHLDMLPPAQRRALRMASAIGSHFDLTLLREALGEPDYEPEPASRNLLIRRLAPSRYSFVHDLVMHCIYESIEREQLRHLHRRLAALYRGRDCALSAHHLYRAGDSGALEMMLRAIREKLSEHQYDIALTLIEQNKAAEPAGAANTALALLKSHAIAGLGRTVQARQCYERALVLAEHPQERIEAVIGLATTLNILDELEEEERLIDETLPLAQAANAISALGQLLYLKGNICFPRGDYHRCRQYHQQAVHYARLSHTSAIEAQALSGLGDSYYAHGRMRNAHDMFDRCIAMCEQHRLVSVEAANRSALGSTKIYLGQPDEAVREAQSSAAIARKVGNRRAEVFARMTAGWVLCATGQINAAQEEVDAGLDTTRSIGALRFEPVLLESKARIAWLRGQRDHAERTMIAAAELVERERLQRYIGPWVLGTLALFTSDPMTRKKALLRGAAYLTQDCLAHNAFRFRVSAAEVALLEGDLVTADFQAEQLDRYAEDDACPWLAHHARLIRAYTSWTLAPSGEGREALRQLAAEANHFGFTHVLPRLHESLSTL